MEHERRGCRTPLATPSSIACQPACQHDCQLVIASSMNHASTCPGLHCLPDVEVLFSVLPQLTPGPSHNSWSSGDQPGTGSVGCVQEHHYLQSERWLLTPQYVTPHPDASHPSLLSVFGICHLRSPPYRSSSREVGARGRASVIRPRLRLACCDRDSFGHAALQNESLALFESSS